MPMLLRGGGRGMLERLERTRESLGAVNPLAAEEYEEAKGRADEAALRPAPTSSARSRSSAGSSATSTAIDRRFAETFSAASARSSTFPAGSGRLRMTEDDVVSVCPPWPTTTAH